jgi:hypothetical protein
MLESIDVRFLFHFQGPWRMGTMADALKLTREAGFQRLSTYTEQRPYSAYQLRQTAALLWPEADLYMLCDDNVIFAAQGTPAYPHNTAERYAQVIDYFQTFPRCGVVTCEGSLGGAIQREAIQPTTSALMATARGMFFRNTMKGVIHTNDEMKLNGGLGESVLAYGLMERGYFIAKSMNHPTRHVHLTKVRAPNATGKALMNDVTLHAEGLAYIRTRYQDPWWTHSSGKFPDSLVTRYLDVGGDRRALYIGCKPQTRSAMYRKDYP